MWWFLTVLFVFVKGQTTTGTTFSLNLCHLKPASVGLRINTPGNGNWKEREPHKATKSASPSPNIWSVLMPPAKPPGHWKGTVVGCNGVAYCGRICTSSRTTKPFTITSGAVGTIGATAVSGDVCLGGPGEGYLHVTNYVWTASKPAPKRVRSIYTIRFFW